MRGKQACSLQASTPAWTRRESIWQRFRNSQHRPQRAEVSCPARALLPRRLEVEPLLPAPAAVGAGRLPAVAPLLLRLHHPLPGKPRAWRMAPSIALHCTVAAPWLPWLPTQAPGAPSSLKPQPPVGLSASRVPSFRPQDEDSHMSLREILATPRGRATVACDILSLVAMTPFVVIEVRRRRPRRGSSAGAVLEDWTQQRLVSAAATGLCVDPLPCANAAAPPERAGAGAAPQASCRPAPSQRMVRGAGPPRGTSWMWPPTPSRQAGTPGQHTTTATHK